MQKTAWVEHLGREALKGIVFGIAFFCTCLVSVVAIAAAATPGGALGAALNSMLVSNNWQAPGDGTVKNAQKLGGKTANQFVTVTANQNCPTNQCIYGILANGTIQCR